MTLLSLPPELLEIIVQHSIPEGLEGLTLTNKLLCQLCMPHIAYHNELSREFGNFWYDQRVLSERNALRTAFSLITRIAVEPVVARYIRNPSLRADKTRALPPRDMLPDLAYGGAVQRLFAQSPYLKEAGLNWETYYAEIEEDLEEGRYSQNAAAFLLTLLPNVQTLSLPGTWKHVETTRKLVDTIIERARDAHSEQSPQSLARITQIKAPFPQVHRDFWGNLHDQAPLLALPQVRYFRSVRSVATSTASRISYPDWGSTLEAVDLYCCSLDELEIAAFLQHTPCLRAFRYTHARKEIADPPDWNPGYFIEAIGREVGSHLEELSIDLKKREIPILPCTFQMHEYLRLQILELHIDIFFYHSHSKTRPPDPRCESSSSLMTAPNQSLLLDIVPDTVSQLAIPSDGTEFDREILDGLFRDFVSIKSTNKLNLKTIYIRVPIGSTQPYRELCETLVSAAAQVDTLIEARFQIDIPNRILAKESLTL